MSTEKKIENNDPAMPSPLPNVNSFKLANILSDVLKGHSNREIREALTMVAGLNGYRLLSNFSQVLPGTNAARSQTGKARSAPPAPKKRTPEEYEARKALELLKVKIKAESDLKGAKLPEDHELIKARNELLIKVKSFRA